MVESRNPSFCDEAFSDHVQAPIVPIWFFLDAALEKHYGNIIVPLVASDVQGIIRLLSEEQVRALNEIVCHWKPKWNESFFYIQQSDSKRSTTVLHEI